MPTNAAPTGESDPSAPLLTWDQAFAAGTAVVGGKGWNLARLVRYGFAVPRGGVVAASVYAELFRTADVAALAAPLAAVTARGAERADVQAQLAALRDPGRPGGPASGHPRGRRPVPGPRRAGGPAARRPLLRRGGGRSRRGVRRRP